MGVKIIVEGSSLADIRAALEAITAVPTTAALPQMSLPLEDASVEPVAKKPVGRPRKAPADETPAAEPVKAEAPKAEEKPKPAKKYSLEDVRTALQEYAKKQDGDPQAGILKVRELLMQFKSTKNEPCQKISELQDADYPAVVAKCAA